MTDADDAGLVERLTELALVSHSSDNCTVLKRAADLLSTQQRDIEELRREVAELRAERDTVKMWLKSSLRTQEDIIAERNGTAFVAKHGGRDG